MNPARTVVKVDRWRHLTPWNLASISSRVAGSAVTNARLSLQDIVAAAHDREGVQEHLEGPAGAGDLRRIPPERCLELLATRSIGRLAYIARSGMPDIVPVTYAFDGTDILIRSAPGPKLQAAERREVVAFEVDDIDETTQTGWSVVVTGQARVLSASEAARALQPQPWANGPRRHTLRIQPRRVDGRELV